MKEQIVISAFDFTTTFVRPWAEAGYLCYCIDTQHPDGETREGNIIRVGCDVRDWLPPRGNIAFSAFWTPCTHLAVSGARWFRGKGLAALRDSIELFAWSARIAEWCECPYLIENPVSTISTYWRAPDFAFDPCDFAMYADDPAEEAYTKRTCLWTGGGFVMPEPRAVVPVLGSKMHTLPGGPSAAKTAIRNATPQGFARAVFAANHRHALAA